MNMSNIYYPTYGNYPQPQIMQQPQQAQQDERIWVQNETSAEAYLLAPNQFVRLWDSSAPRFYEKRADASGRPYPMETFEYKRKQAPTPLVEDSKADEIQSQIEALMKRVEALEKKKGVKLDAKQSNADDATV